MCRRPRRRLRGAFSVLFWSFVTLCRCVALSNSDGPRGDVFALFQIKSSLNDPAGVLSGWSSGDSHACGWFGVSCNAERRVVALNLTETGGKPSSLTDSCLPPLVWMRAPRWKLAGKISPAVGSLTELRVLSLGFNELSGGIPVEIGRLQSLEVLDLGYNRLSGPIPSEISGCVGLNSLNLAGNQLNGTLPRSLGFLPRLRGLFLEFNLLSGPVPDDLGSNCGYLERLHLAGNRLSGGIPAWLGNCSNMRSLLLFSNILDGSIPLEIGKLSVLETLDISRNSISGPIPSQLGNCSQLSVLVLSNSYDPQSFSSLPGSYLDADKGEYNFFEGFIPAEVISLPKLRVIWAPNSNLEGSFSSEWGNCSSLKMVSLAQNFLSGNVSTVFSKCKKLAFLDLSLNRFTGALSERLPVPCMAVFNVSGNLLSGSIPRFIVDGCLDNLAMGRNIKDPFDFGSLYFGFFTCSVRIMSSFSKIVGEDSVVFYDFSMNNFSGFVPLISLAAEGLRTRPIYAISASHNRISGPIHVELFNMCKDFSGIIANFSDNEISGQLPADIGTWCSTLKALDLSGNSISGPLPPSIANLSSLIGLDLSRNKLTGSIPAELGRLKDLQYLSLAENNFTGKIPPSLSFLPSLKSLVLYSNSLSGEIPWEITRLRNLSVLLLDKNNLYGQIPSDFTRVTSLLSFNASFNNLSGPVPSNLSLTRCNSFMGNPFLQPCIVSAVAVASPSSSSPGKAGSPPQSASPPSGRMDRTSNRFTSIQIASITSGSAILFVLLALLVLLWYTRQCAPRAVGQGPGRREVITFSDIGVTLTFENVVRATGGFNASNCIGNGGFGATYKAEISPGVLVAIKRLSVGRFQGVQQFEAEIKTLGRARHPNLVTLIGFHASETEMFLIYNYLPGGNLEKFIRERSKRDVDWRMLQKIALDIARALAYLHDECVPRVLHRDIKPSNILLDNDYTAYLSDFGLARLLGTSETHATTDVAGTFGYVAPEYAMTCRVSDKADVYSYGVVLMELVSDKKALDPSFSSYGNGFNIVQWACMLLTQGRAREFFTAGLWDTGRHDDLVETLHLAVMCTVESLSIRPSMKQVVQRLKQLQPPAC